MAETLEQTMDRVGGEAEQSRKADPKQFVVATVPLQNSMTYAEAQKVAQ